MKQNPYVTMIVLLSLLFLTLGCTTGVRKSDVTETTEETPLAAESPSPTEKASEPAPLPAPTKTTPAKPTAEGEPIKKSLALVLKLNDQKEFGGYVMQITSIQGDTVTVLINGQELLVSETQPGKLDNKTEIRVEVYDAQKAKLELTEVS